MKNLHDLSDPSGSARILYPFIKPDMKMMSEKYFELKDNGYMTKFDVFKIEKKKAEKDYDSEIELTD